MAELSGFPTDFPSIQAAAALGFRSIVVSSGIRLLPHGAEVQQGRQELQQCRTRLKLRLLDAPDIGPRTIDDLGRTLLHDAIEGVAPGWKSLLIVRHLGFAVLPPAGVARDLIVDANTITVPDMPGVDARQFVQGKDSSRRACRRCLTITKGHRPFGPMGQTPFHPWRARLDQN